METKDLVPAVVFYGSKDITDRTLVWESDAILQALDERFPETPRLVHSDSSSYQAALELQDRLQTAGFQFTYGGRNQTLSDTEKLEKRQAFNAVLDELDAALGEEQQRSGEGFRLGAFSALDAIMMPTLERWRYQLPITTSFDILKGRSHLQRWFDTMESFAPYADRVAGDQYSWTATTSMFLRYFGGGDDKPEVAAGIVRADAAAKELTGSFSNYQVSRTKDAALTCKAAAKLISNHKAVVADCTLQEPLSQQRLARASDPEIADAALRHATSILIATIKYSIFDEGGDELAPAAAIQMAKMAPLVILSDPNDAARALRTVATRLCVPRDIGAPSAGILRGVLNVLAERLDAVAEQ